ncbi:MAG TPA: hypothetical protein VGO93_02610 [Candidatus Xenobia bacterium]|jgi:hypothetical protein
MKKKYCCIAVLALGLAGCGGGVGGGSQAGGFAGPVPAAATGGDQNSNGFVPADGSVLVQVTNPALPATTQSLLYTVTDQQGDLVDQTQVPYSGGTPAVQTFNNVPAVETETVGVQALDGGGSPIITGTNQVYVNIDAAPTVQVTIGPPNAIAQLVFVSEPANVVAGASLNSIVVGLVDATNNIAVGAADAVTVAGVSVTPVFGLATFSGLTFNTTGSGDTLVASCDAAPPVTSAPFNVVAGAGAPTQLAFTVQPFPVTTMNIPFVPSPEVAVEDANGVIVNTSSATVDLAILNNPSGGFLAGNVSLAAAQGIATFPGLSINVQGSNFTLQGTSNGLVPATSAPFIMLNDQSGPNPQTGNVDSTGDGGGLFE